MHYLSAVEASLHYKTSYQSSNYLKAFSAAPIFLNFSTKLVPSPIYSIISWQSSFITWILNFPDSRQFEYLYEQLVYNPKGCYRKELGVSEARGWNLSENARAADSSCRVSRNLSRLGSCKKHPTNRPRVFSSLHLVGLRSLDVKTKKTKVRGRWNDAEVVW